MPTEDRVGFLTEFMPTWRYARAWLGVAQVVSAASRSSRFDFSVGKGVVRPKADKPYSTTVRTQCWIDRRPQKKTALIKDTVRTPQASYRPNIIRRCKLDLTGMHTAKHATSTFTCLTATGECGTCVRWTS
jgi:hypothetical protein